MNNLNQLRCIHRLCHQLVAPETVGHLQRLNAKPGQEDDHDILPARLANQLGSLIAVYTGETGIQDHHAEILFPGKLHCFGTGGGENHPEPGLLQRNAKVGRQAIVGCGNQD